MTLGVLLRVGIAVANGVFNWLVVTGTSHYKQKDHITDEIDSLYRKERRRA